MRRLLLPALAVLGLIAASPAHAQRADCERLTDAHAYNRCLAAAGPASRAGAGASAQPRPRAQPSRSAPRRQARPQPAARSGATVRRLPSGRMRLSIPASRRR